MKKLTSDFAEFEIKDSSIKVEKEGAQFEKIGCVGSAEESFGTKTVTKKCEGKITKQRTFPDGSGELKLSLHMKWTAYIALFNLEREELKEGVYAYGAKAHEVFAFVCKALDMDGNEKYKAYPNCTIKDGIARKVENGGEEVAEIELTVALAADKYGECMYEALKEESEEGIGEKWMKDWNHELIKKAAAEQEESVGGEK